MLIDRLHISRSVSWLECRARVVMTTPRRIRMKRRRRWWWRSATWERPKRNVFDGRLDFAQRKCWCGQFAAWRDAIAIALISEMITASPRILCHFISKLFVSLQLFLPSFNRRLSSLVELLLISKQSGVSGPLGRPFPERFYIFFSGRVFRVISEPARAVWVESHHGTKVWWWM